MSQQPQASPVEENFPLPATGSAEEQALAQVITEITATDSPPSLKRKGDPNKVAKKRKRKQKIELDPITDFDDIPDPILPPPDGSPESFFQKVYQHYTFTLAWLIKLCGEAFPEYQYIQRKEVNQSLSAGNRNGFTINFVWKAVQRLMREHGTKSPLTFWDPGSNKAIFVSNLKQICPTAIALTSLGRTLVEPIISLEKTKKSYRAMTRRNPDEIRRFNPQLEVIAPVPPYALIPQVIQVPHLTTSQSISINSQSNNVSVSQSEFRALQMQVEQLKSMVSVLMSHFNIPSENFQLPSISNYNGT